MSDNLIDFGESPQRFTIAESSFLAINDLATDGFLGRESLPFLSAVDATDCSRESLGILHANLPGFDTFGDFDTGCNSDGFLNIAFINSPKLLQSHLQNNVRISLGSNVSSYSSIFLSPSDIELSTISKIPVYSLDHRSNLNDPFNEAFCYKSKFPFSLFDDKNGNNKQFESLEEFRIRMRSLPEPLIIEQKCSPLENSFKMCTNVNRRCLSEKEPLIANKLRSSFHNDLEGEGENANEFNDSVFIEANHIASKIADGSVWNENPEDINNLLDSTPQPEWYSDDEIEQNPQNEVVKNEQVVFKKIDKLILPLVQIEQSDNAPQCEVCDNNLSNNRSDASQKSKSSNEAKEILQNLSLILSSESRTDQDKSRGLNLLNSLAAILNKQVNLDDSGNSSIDIIEPESLPAKEQDFECYEVLDLRTKSVNSEENIEVLDLSMKNKVQDSKKRLSQSFSVQRTTNVCNRPLKDNQTATMPHFGLDSSSKNSNSGSKSNKLKPKKSEDKTKKGPLKAVLPLDNMAKGLQNKQITPKVTFYKKTSTPVQKSKLKPMAQSTPESQCETKNSLGVYSKGQFEFPISPLARPRSYSNANQKTSLNSRSGSVPELSTSMSNTSKSSSSSIPIQTSGLNRRKSASDLKQQKNVLLKRSFCKNKENLSKSSNASDGSITMKKPSNFDSKISTNSTTVKVLKEINTKPTNLLSKINKSVH